jgi:hypothetical protein
LIDCFYGVHFVKFIDFLKQVQQQIISFKLIGEGSYNLVLSTISEVAIEDNPPQSWVLKQPKEIYEGELPMNMTSRAHRKFTQIYPDVPVFDIPVNQGLVLPFFESAPNDDKLLAETVLSIYQNTRMIIADGGLPSNFGFYEDKLICIDMDLALSRDSILSDEYYNQVISTSRYDRFFEQIAETQHTYGTLELIKTLFYIENQLHKVEFDTHLISQWMIERLHAYRLANQTFDLSSITFLKTIEENIPEISYELLIPSEIEIIKSENLAIGSISEVLAERLRSQHAAVPQVGQVGISFFESLPKIVHEVHTPKAFDAANSLEV